jgi:hypothetical protein
MSIPELEQQRRKVHETFSKADAALQAGTLSKEEHTAILNHYFGTASEAAAIAKINEQREEYDSPFTRSNALVGCFAVLMLSLFSALFFATGGITGLVVQDSATPKLVSAIPDVAGSYGVELEISRYFENVEHFTSTDQAELTESVEGGMFRARGPPGTYTYQVIASNDAGFTPSNTFSVTIS